MAILVVSLILENSLSEPRWIDGTYVLRLRGVGAFDVAQRRICLNDTGLYEVVQAEQVLVVAEAVEISSAKWQSAKVLSNGGKEGLCGGDAEGDVRSIFALGVVRCFHLRNSPLAGSTEEREWQGEGKDINAHHL
jgi:hypothetical protein